MAAVVEVPRQLGEFEEKDIVLVQHMDFAKVWTQIATDGVDILSARPVMEANIEGTSGYWFKYFYDEAKNQDFPNTPEEKAMFLNFLNKTLEKTDGWPERMAQVFHNSDLYWNNPPLKAKHGGDLWQLVGADDFRRLLDAMLKKGFDGVLWKKGGKNPDDMSHYIKEVSNGRWTFDIRWRSESTRNLDDLRETGYGNRALMDHFKRSLNLGAPWHPYSMPENNVKVWFRKRNTDNDYYVVTSVADDWHAALTFPKISQNAAWALGNGPKAQVTFRGGQGALGDVVEERMVTESNLALMLVHGMYFDTAEYQEKKENTKPFPEVAFGSIPGTNIMGVAKYIRVHHGATDEDGFTAVQDRLGCTEVFSQGKNVEAVVKRAERSHAKELLKAAWDSVTNEPVLSGHWKTTGFGYDREPEKNRKIVRIVRDGTQIYSV